MSLGGQATARRLLPEAMLGTPILVSMAVVSSGVPGVAFSVLGFRLWLSIPDVGVQVAAFCSAAAR